MDERAALHRVRAYGRSMWPFVPPGTTLAVAPLGERLPEVGEIVVGVRGGHVIAHRVVRVEASSTETSIVTRGDAHDVDDPSWRPAELLGVVTTADLFGVELALRRPLPAAFGRWIATHPGAVAGLRSVALPAARAGRAAALAATWVATRAGVLRPRVSRLEPRDERDLDRLLLLLHVDAAAAAAARSTTLAAELRAGIALGARLAGRLAAVVLPAPWLGQADSAAPRLAVHPFARGAVERPLVDAWLAAGGARPVPLHPPPPWLHLLYSRQRVRLGDHP
ncbi:MAG: S24/S26 family peptidase [Deltaproteobacteria bacterium]|nr:S24/S26 family peptidase [Deltaproteobacteria bacterium]